MLHTYPRIKETSYRKMRAPKRLAFVLIIVVGLIACDDSTSSNSMTAGVSTDHVGERAGGHAEVQAGEHAGDEHTGGENVAREVSSCLQVDGSQIEVAQRLIDNRCSLCHGETPQYGAPYPLTDLKSLTETDEGLHRIERSVTRLLEGTMPPAGQPRPDSMEAQAFVDWATCGEGRQYVAPPGGFEVDRPVYRGRTELPADAIFTDYIAPNTSIDSGRNDEYQCFGFQGPSDPTAVGSSPRSILRFEPVIDEARIVHHIVLYETDRDVIDGAQTNCGAGLGAAVYAWAPGQDALHFREGGLVSSSDKRYILELHYNNSASLEGLTDASGVRVYHSSPVAPAIDMMTLGPDGFVLPARQRTEVLGDCVIEEEVEVIALMPHMHEIGTDISAQIMREGEDRWEDLITLRGWDFNAQLIYDAQETILQEGDRVRTRCVFDNPDDGPRSFGPFTDDEMCYHFVYVTPPPRERRCDLPVEAPPMSYPVGACAPEFVEEHESVIMGQYFEGAPTPLAGGVLPAGDFILQSVEVWFPSYDLGIAVLDPVLSLFEVAGALSIDEERNFALDLQGETTLISAEGAQFMRAVNLSFGGVFTLMNGDMAGLNAEFFCPEENNVQFSFEYTPSQAELTLHLPFSTPVEGVQVMRFTPQ